MEVLSVEVPNQLNHSVAYHGYKRGDDDMTKTICQVYTRLSD